jgi:hypothetical protein
LREGSGERRRHTPEEGGRSKTKETMKQRRREHTVSACVVSSRPIRPRSSSHSGPGVCLSVARQVQPRASHRANRSQTSHMHDEFGKPTPRPAPRTGTQSIALRLRAPYPARNENVCKSQSVLIMTNPIISPCTGGRGLWSSLQRSPHPTDKNGRAAQLTKTARWGGLAHLVSQLQHSPLFGRLRGQPQTANQA